jgi:putative DNA primase/helicase
MTNIFLAEAIKLTEMGWRVFPVRPQGKVPLVPHWPKLASKEKSQLLEWWQKWPNANVGLCTGGGLVVIDIDPKNGGDISALPIERKEHETPTVLTGGGGVHLYYKSNGKNYTNARGGLPPGIDIRGEGGFVVAPPSNHASGKSYLWECGFEPWAVPLLPLPAGIGQLLPNGNWSAQPAAPSQDVRAVISIGERNQKLTSIAGALRRQGFSKEQILEQLFVINERDLQEPLEAQEVAQIAESMSRYPQGVSRPLEQERRPLNGGLNLSVNGTNGTNGVAILEGGHHLTDMRNASRLISRHGKNMAYCATWKKWLVWDGKKWQASNFGALGLAKETVLTIYTEAQLECDPKIGMLLAAHAKKSESESSLNSMVNLAKESALTGPDEWDKQPNLFNCANGTIDLKTGEIKPHAQADKITKLSDIEYNPAARSELWEQFLTKIFNL